MDNQESRCADPRLDVCVDGVKTLTEAHDVLSSAVCECSDLSRSSAEIAKRCHSEMQRHVERVEPLMESCDSFLKKLMPLSSNFLQISFMAVTFVLILAAGLFVFVMTLANSALRSEELVKKIDAKLSQKETEILILQSKLATAEDDIKLLKLRGILKQSGF